MSGVPTGGTEELKLRSLVRTFEGTSPTTSVGVIDISEVTTAYATFLNSEVDASDNVANWNVSNITNMSRMFQNAAVYNGPVGTWDVSNVIDMSSMFSGAAVFDQDLSAWGPQSRWCDQYAVSV